MIKKRGCVIVGLIFILIISLSISLSFVSAVGVTIVSTNDTHATIDISGAENLYAYEVDLDYSGSIINVDFDDFLSVSAGNTTTGNNERNSISSVYESRLDSTVTGVTGSGELFTVTHSGGLSLRYALFINNDNSEEYIYYNVSVVSPGSGRTRGGGGGGGGASSETVRNLVIDLREINLDMVASSDKERIIRITNNGDEKRTIYVDELELEGLVSFSEESFDLAPGEYEDLRIIFNAPDKPGIYTGKVLISGNNVLVSINARSKELLFDVGIVVPDFQKKIEIGGKLNAQVTLIPMADDPRVDVTLNYIIKDFDGKIFLQESETILIEEQKNFKKEFFTSDLPVGDYVVGIEVIYPNGVATSSSHFSIAEEVSFDLRNFLNLRIVLYVLGFFVLILIIMIIFISRRYSKRRKRLLKKRRK